MPTDPERRGPLKLTLAEARRMHRGQMRGTVMASSSGPDGELLDAYTGPASEIFWSPQVLGWPAHELDGDEDLDLDLDEEAQR